MKTNLIALLILLTTLLLTPQASSLNNIENTSQSAEQNSVLEGANLFDGTQSLINGGPACNSCHNLNSKIIVSGGLLGKDLTDVYARLGDAGLSGILGAPPFPAMASAYNNSRVTEEEIMKLKAFLRFVDSSEQTVVSNDGVFLLYGPIGLIIWLILIYFFWFNRKKESVKQAVFDRQIKPIN